MSHIQMYDVTVDRCCPSSKKQKWIPVYRVPQREGRPPGQTWRWTPLPGLPDAYIRPGSGPQCSSDQRTQQHWSKSLKRKSYWVCWSIWKHQTDFEISFQVRRGLVPTGCEITSKLLDGGHRSSDEAKKGQKSVWCKTTSQYTSTQTLQFSQHFRSEKGKTVQQVRHLLRHALTKINERTAEQTASHNVRLKGEEEQWCSSGNTDNDNEEQLPPDAHLIGVWGGMIVLSSSETFFFGVLSTCDLRAGGDSKHLIYSCLSDHCTLWRRGKKAREITFWKQAPAPSHLHHRTAVRQSLGSWGRAPRTAGWGRCPVGRSWWAMREEKHHFQFPSHSPFHQLRKRHKGISSQPNTVIQPVFKFSQELESESWSCYILASNNVSHKIPLDKLNK